MYTSIKRIITKEYIPFLALILCFFTFSQVFRYAVEQFWQSGEIVRKEVSLYKTLIDGSSEYEEFKNEIKDKQTQLEKKHTELTQGLADPQDLSGLLQMIFDKAWDADIRFDKTVPQKETQGKDYMHYPVLLEMSTTYKSLGKFVSSLERMPQIVRVDRVAMSAKDNETISARMLITCFLRLQK
jgi:Tfp pilus assembly protein PilO